MRVARGVLLRNACGVPFVSQSDLFARAASDRVSIP
jgi:hypothetical protein